MSKKNRKAKKTSGVTTVAAPAETTKVAEATAEVKDKDKAIVEALKKGGTTKKGKKAAGSKSTSPRVTIDSVTMDLLRKPGGVTKADIVAALVKAFPGHPEETLEATTKRRISHYLSNKFGVKITKDDNGKYSIAA